MKSEMKFGLATLILTISCFSCSYRVSHPNNYRYSLADTVSFKVRDKKHKIDSLYVTSNNRIIKGNYHDERYYMSATEFYPGTNSITINTLLKNGKRIKKDSSLFIISDVIPEKYHIQGIEILPHDTSAFTQGLAYHKGMLYESTGIKGWSRLRVINPDDGNCLKDYVTDPKLFNEGITIINDTIYQLTWKDSLMITRNLDFSITKRVRFPSEGWGLCSNNGILYFSDGSNRIIKLNPYSNAFIDTIRVIDNTGPVYYINEMEWVDGFIWANIYGKDKIAVIDTNSGKVVATIYVTGLIDRKQYPEAGVMNGIAYDSVSGRVFLTGKNWPFIKVCKSYFGE